MPDSDAIARFEAAIERIDAANREDPHQKELAYAESMAQWLNRLVPDASEPLRLAVRAQHIRRWTIPRDSYPKTRQGYHRWRSDLADFHAETAGEILREVGYADAIIARVQSLLRKENLKSDPETQTLEDVACLVFLENYFQDFAAKHDEQKVLNILRRTWGKMSQRGRDAAMGINLDPRSLDLLKRAIGGV